MDNAMKAPALAGLEHIEPLTNPIIISDLHLTMKKPKTIAAFLRFMKSTAPRYAELVILGDLFDFWIGDDACEPAQPILAILKLFTATGRRLIVMPGNRDVMLGAGFAAATGAELVKDPIAVDIKGRKVLLAHGDEWCLRDEDYQKFRAMTHNPAWQLKALSLPAAERLKLAEQARAQSEGDKTQKSAADMDVVQTAVAEAASAAGCDLVIHGHTHKPAAHVNEAVERWVLPDWELDSIPEGTTGRSGAITFIDGSQPQIQMF